MAINTIGDIALSNINSKFILVVCNAVTSLITILRFSPSLYCINSFYRYNATLYANCYSVICLIQFENVTLILGSESISSVRNLDLKALMTPATKSTKADIIYCSLCC